MKGSTPPAAKHLREYRLPGHDTNRRIRLGEDIKVEIQDWLNVKYPDQGFVAVRTQNNEIEIQSNDGHVILAFKAITTYDTTQLYCDAIKEGIYEKCNRLKPKDEADYEPAQPSRFTIAIKELDDLINGPPVANGGRIDGTGEDPNTVNNAVPAVHGVNLPPDRVKFEAAFDKQEGNEFFSAGRRRFYVITTEKKADEIRKKVDKIRKITSVEVIQDGSKVKIPVRATIPQIEKIYSILGVELENYTCIGQPAISTLEQGINKVSRDKIHDSYVEADGTPTRGSTHPVHLRKNTGQPGLPPLEVLAAAIITLVPGAAIKAQTMTQTGREKKEYLDLTADDARDLATALGKESKWADKIREAAKNPGPGHPKCIVQ